jgi:hypothetical protein
MTLRGHGNCTKAQTEVANRVHLQIVTPPTLLTLPLGRQAASDQRTEPTQLAEIIRRMREEDIQALRAAVATLEHPGCAARLAEIGENQSSYSIGPCRRLRRRR